MTAGPRGPMLLQDVWFLEKLADFDREDDSRSTGCMPRVPAPMGRSPSPTTSPATPRPRNLFCSGKEDRNFTRFSTVAGEPAALPMPNGTSGFCDQVVYTEEGNWDLVGNNTPVFFLRSPQIPRPQPRREEGPPHQPAQRPQRLGFWTSLPEASRPILPS